MNVGVGYCIVERRLSVAKTDGLGSTAAEQDLGTLRRENARLRSEGVTRSSSVNDK